MVASIAIAGAGNVGQAIAGHMAVLGNDVRLFSRWDEDFDAIRANGGIELTGEVTGRGMPDLLTTDLAEAVRGVPGEIGRAHV